MEKQELTLAAVFGSLVHPVVGAFFGVPHGPAAYLFFTAWVLIPLLVMAAIARALRKSRARFLPWRWAFRGYALATLALQTAAQVLAYQSARADAQGALLFIFLPLYAHAAAAVVAGVAAVIAAMKRSDGRVTLP